jgi:hypothetical protein
VHRSFLLNGVGGSFEITAGSFRGSWVSPLVVPCGDIFLAPCLAGGLRFDRCMERSPYEHEYHEGLEAVEKLKTL